jgi:hypothetical protein
MVVELFEEFLFARHQCLEKLQHCDPRFGATACYARLRASSMGVSG